jgi:hypothetical protein
MNKGKKVWIFPDGDLPPHGGSEPHGHESLVILNLNEQDTQVEFDIYFDDKDPVIGLKDVVKGRRVRCFRMDEPLTEKGYKVPMGQYALVVKSELPIVAQIGRMDVRQPNLAYYTVMGYNCD